ncbi:MAG: protein kinase domain-containing protein [Actinomycetota bacterium]
MPDPQATLAERYVLESRIASGGMATVWRARDDVLARPVAVKLLHPSLAEDGSFVERFRVEALAAARLSHPNIVAIYDTGTEEHPESKPAHFIVMEYCGGGTLRELIEREGPLDADRVRAIGSTICDALGYAHRNGVIHRDIKPANVLISDHNALKVTDFGIAKAAFATGDITTTGVIVGTVTYISPEQANGDEPDARSDLYALGITLYEALVGRPPFQAETEVATALKHIHDAPSPPRSLRAGVPRDLEQVILKSLSKDPDDRFTSAEEMKTALAGGRSASTQVIRTPPPKEANAARTDAPTTGPMEFVSTEGKRLLSVISLVIAAIVAAIVVASLVGEGPSLPGDSEDDGGRGTDRPAAMKIEAASDFDPEGGDGEHPTDVPRAYDGDRATAWTTSSYSDALSLIKDGVGLRFDLGRSVEVGEVEVVFDRAGYSVELLASDQAGSSASDYDVVAETSSSGPVETFEAGTKARYWVVWITGFPGGGGGRGAIAEVRFVGG